MKMQSIEEIRKQEEAVIEKRKRMLETRIEDLLKKKGNYLNSKIGYINYPYLDLHDVKIVPEDFELLKEIFDARGYSLESRKTLDSFFNVIDYGLSLKAK